MARASQLLIDLFYKIRIGLSRAVEGAWGTRPVPWFLLPFITVEILRHAPTLGPFKRGRAKLPAGFWRGEGLLRHAIRKGWYWQGCTSVFYDRLQSPEWRKNIRITGTPPHHLPGWGKRSVVLAFMHISGFPNMRYWLRAQGVPTAGYALLISRMYVNCGHVRDAGDRLYGLEGVPHLFFGPRQMRETIKFLKQGGTALMVSVDSYVSPTDVPYDLNGVRFYLQDGAARMAASTNAILQPVSVLQRGFLSFDIQFHDPVPDEVVMSGDSRLATQRVGETLWAVAEKNPKLITADLLRSIHPKGLR